MIVFVSEQSGCQLLEFDDFRKFSVNIAAPMGRLDEWRKVARDVVEFEDESTAWVSADALRNMPSVKSNATWQSGLVRMIEKAKPHGWIREAPKLAIKAHVVWGASNARE